MNHLSQTYLFLTLKFLLKCLTSACKININKLLLINIKIRIQFKNVVNVVHLVHLVHLLFCMPYCDYLSKRAIKNIINGKGVLDVLAPLFTTFKLLKCEMNGAINLPI